MELWGRPKEPRHKNMMRISSTPDQSIARRVRPIQYSKVFLAGCRIWDLGFRVQGCSEVLERRANHGPFAGHGTIS